MLASSAIAFALATFAFAAPAPAVLPAAAPQLVQRENDGSKEYSFRKVALDADGFTNERWTAAYERAKEVVAGMSFEQKMNFTTLGRSAGLCSARTYPIEQADGADIEFCFADGPTGANTAYSTQYPAEITTAATWNRELIYARAAAMGSEYEKLGVHVPLSIAVGPMGRHPLGGRNWEGFGAEPYLAGEAVRLTVQGMQDHGVIGLVKHFVGNEQEWLRVGAPQGGYFFNYLNQTVNSIIDPATLHELYVWPFTEAIRAGAGAIMCSYNLYNGKSACESDELLNQLLKDELNFHGFVLTDWGAGHTTTGVALNGTDWVAAGSANGNLFGDILAEYINNGTLPADIADDKIMRMLTPYFALEQPTLPETDLDRYVADDYTAKVARKVAEDSMTLLKNVRSTDDQRGLPLQDPKHIVLVGSAAAPAHNGWISNLHAITYFAPWGDYEGFNSDGYGSGGSPAPYAVDPLAGFVARGQKQEGRPTHVDYYARDDPLAGTVRTPFNNISYLDTKLGRAETAVVFVTAVAMEGFDREDLKLQYGGDELIDYVASRHNDTIVVVTAPGPVEMSAWSGHENVTSILFTYFTGQEGGHAMASVVFGDVNPSGKLPFTIAKDTADYDAGAIWHGNVTVNPPIPFDEGVFIDYKYFDQQGIKPLYEFGFGLSYSTFEVSDVAVTPESEKAYAPVRETKEKFFVNGEEASGLYDVVYKVSATVKNTGDVEGAEVAQLYLSFPDSVPKEMPVHSLRGFEKPHLAAGASQSVTFELRNKDLSYYDPEVGGWVRPSGDFKVAVGTSSRKIAGEATLSV